MSLRDLFTQRLETGAQLAASLLSRIDEIVALAQLVSERLEDGATLYTCGNGGSAEQAMHLAEELVGRYRADRAPQRAICLNADPATLTCIANDFGFDHVFSRQCRALLTERDVLLVLSTSGNSANLVQALQTAREKGAATFSLLGKHGGACRCLCDRALLIDSEDAAHIQEAHLAIIHLICEAVERRLR